LLTRRDCLDDAFNESVIRETIRSMDMVAIGTVAYRLLGLGSHQTLVAFCTQNVVVQIGYSASTRRDLLSYSWDWPN
jgi:hypothetical protein